MEAAVSFALLATAVNDLEPWCLVSGSSERWAGGRKRRADRSGPHTRCRRADGTTTNRSVSWILEVTRPGLRLARVRPSSGNLHPTEGYLIAGPVEGTSRQGGRLQLGAPRARRRKSSLDRTTATDIGSRVRGFASPFLGQARTASSGEWRPTTLRS